MLIYLQYLRGFAALMVVYFHISIQGNSLSMDSIILPEFGELGVDLFFVLSGFIMVYITEQKNVTAVTFLKERFLRIAPLYWLLTLLASTVALILPELLKSTEFNLVHFFMSLTFIPVIHPIFNQQVWPVVIPGWTLNYEMYFYLLFSLSLLCSKQSKVITLTVLMTCVFILVRYFYTEALAFTWFYGDLIVYEFIFGGMIGVLINKGIYSQRAVISFTIVIISVVMFLALPQTDLSRLFHFGIPAALLIYGLVSLNLIWPIYINQWLTLLGDSSYSLYLSHVFVITFVRVLLSKLLPNDSELLVPLFIILSFSLSLAVAVFTYAYIEKPLGRWSKRFL